MVTLLDKGNLRFLSEWAENMQQKQQIILQLAKKAQQSKDDHHIVTASPKRTEYPIDSYVLVKYRNRPPTKFHTNWKGPMQVIKFSKSEYTLLNLVTNKHEKYHMTQLKPFRYDLIHTNPLDVARAEDGEFVVESILGHRSASLRSEMEFHVKWLNYDDKHNTWEPWKHVKNNEILIRYCYQNKLKKLLTQEQKAEAKAYLEAEV